jgi:hypothetical protein
VLSCLRIEGVECRPEEYLADRAGLGHAASLLKRPSARLGSRPPPDQSRFSALQVERTSHKFDPR